MKTLQNNFTTPEQSKRLLELGIPADSADCYFYNWDLKDTKTFSKGGSPQIFDWFERDITKFESRKFIEMYPCWSVGRLREIFCICSSVSGNREYPFYNDQVAWWITEFEFKKESIDFSKLEE